MNRETRAIVGRRVTGLPPFAVPGLVLTFLVLLGCLTAWASTDVREGTKTAQRPMFLADWIRLVREHPDSAALRLSLARAYRRRNRLTDAIFSYSAALHLDSGLRAAVFERGEVLEELGRWNEAAADFRQGMKSKEYRERSLLGLARVQIAAGREKEGGETARRVREEFPENPVGYSLGGAVALEREEYETAIAFFSKALEKDSNDLRNVVSRAFALMKAGRFEEADSDFSRLLRNGSDHPLLWLDEGLVLFHLGRLDEAERYFRTVLYRRADTTVILEAEFLLGAVKFLRNDTDALSYLKGFLSRRGWGAAASPYTATLLYFEYLRVGDEANANRILHLALTRLKDRTWPFPIFGFFAKEISETDLLRIAGTSDRLTEALAYVAWFRFLRGDRSGAARLVRRLEKEGERTMVEYALARRLAERLRRDGKM
ncbi:MAG: hypothetical protein D6679_11515 [Candidatus Hydrogenedentota bacterium]|nr:MAG: hypothetical protein D6679_11515 [Candidatus Hydrogenedentota bacterium]